MDYLKILFFIFFSFFAIIPIHYSLAIRNKRMIGTNSTKHSNFPYQVYIISRNNFVCGGSILDNYHVISAAHCFINDSTLPISWNEGSVEVVAGISNLKRDDRTNWVTASVQKIYIPKVYNDSMQNNDTMLIGDVAVLKLETSLNLTKNSHLKAVRLPETEDFLYINETAVVTGYGLKKIFSLENAMINGREWKIPIGAYSNKLRFANTTVLNNTECQSRWNQDPMPRGWLKANVTDKHICAQVHSINPSYPAGVCNGDSGGPLVFNSTILIGILSGGPFECDEKVIPGFYTRISAFKGFIEKVRNNGGYDPEILTTEPPIIH